jgi:hypothetical protein
VLAGSCGSGRTFAFLRDSTSAYRPQRLRDVVNTARIPGLSEDGYVLSRQRSELHGLAVCANTRWLYQLNGLGEVFVSPLMAPASTAASPVRGAGAGASAHPAVWIHEADSKHIGEADADATYALAIACAAAPEHATTGSELLRAVEQATGSMVKNRRGDDDTGLCAPAPIVSLPAMARVPIKRPHYARAPSYWQCADCGITCNTQVTVGWTLRGGTAEGQPDDCRLCKICATYLQSVMQSELKRRRPEPSTAATRRQRKVAATCQKTSQHDMLTATARFNPDVQLETLRGEMLEFLRESPRTLFEVATWLQQTHGVTATAEDTRQYIASLGEKVQLSSVQPRAQNGAHVAAHHRAVISCTTTHTTNPTSKVYTRLMHLWNN